MKIVTQTISPDEPCHGLFEGPRDGRWIQAVYVIRGDAIAEWTKDYGLEEDFDRITPLLMPSFGENSVGSMQYFADKNREDDFWAKRTDEMIEGSTLIEDHVRQVEIDQEIIHNRSVFGPAIRVQRGAYSHGQAMRNLMEKVDAYHGVGVWNRSQKR